MVSVGAIDNILLNPLSQQGKRITVPGVPLPKGQTSFEIDYAAADSGLLGSIGVSIIRGRGITAADAPGAPRVAVVNEQFAKHYWPGADAVGKHIRLDSRTGALVEIFTLNTWLRIATDGFYIQMLMRTTLIGLLITLLTLLVSYPIAFFIYRNPSVGSHHGRCQQRRDHQDDHDRT